MKKENIKKYTAKEKKEAYKLVGSLGGKATFKKLGREGMSLIGQRGAKARWGK